MTSEWGWRPSERQGFWSTGPAWMRPLASAAPWLTVIFALLMFVALGNVFTTAKGLLFELPQAELGDGEVTDLVAMVTTSPRDTLVFFDDARYQLEDPAAVAVFRDDLAERLRTVRRRSLLVLADLRVSSGELMKLAAAAKAAGVERILFAEKREGMKRE